MAYLSTHFTEDECSCKHCSMLELDPKLLVLMELVRGINGNKPITPNSVFRCHVHNTAIGGAVTSYHTKGMAADMPVDDPRVVYGTLCNLFPDSYGFGLYDTFVHIDCREKKARWTG